MRTITVRCTYEIVVEVPDDVEDGYSAQFDIEESHCPGTGRVGAAFDALYKRHEKANTCWACSLNGKSEIIFPPVAATDATQKQESTAGWAPRLANDLRNLFKLYGIDPEGPSFGSFVSAMEETLTDKMPTGKA
jgi:hypothetical protein